MKKLSIVWIGLLLIGCGSPDQGQVNSDEVHRQTDWRCSVLGILQLDTLADEWNQATFIELSSSTPLQQLSDRLFEVAFTGDSKVFASDIFGVVDIESALTPEGLLEELKVIDTTSIEDLQTGKLRDTVIDLSFTQDEVSALRIFCSIDGETSQLNPRYAGIGSQVFDHESGRLRGLSFKFYVQVGEGMSLGSSSESLVMQTDSMGLFRPMAFLMHNEDSDRGISDIAREKFGSETNQVQCSFDLHYDNSNGRFYLQELKLSLVEQPL